MVGEGGRRESKDCCAEQSGKARIETTKIKDSLEVGCATAEWETVRESKRERERGGEGEE